jgi:hypothetical protein
MSNVETSEESSYICANIANSDNDSLLSIKGTVDSIELIMALDTGAKALIMAERVRTNNFEILKSEVKIRNIEGSIVGSSAVRRKLTLQ